MSMFTQSQCLNIDVYSSDPHGPLLILPYRNLRSVRAYRLPPTAYHIDIKHSMSNIKHTRSSDVLHYGIDPMTSQTDRQAFMVPFPSHLSTLVRYIGKRQVHIRMHTFIFPNYPQESPADRLASESLQQLTYHESIGLTTIKPKFINSSVKAAVQRNDQFDLINHRPVDSRQTQISILHLAETKKTKPHMNPTPTRYSVLCIMYDLGSS